MECSNKVLKELGLAKHSIGYGAVSADPFFTWYVQLFNVGEEKCLVFVNLLTRYPVIALNLTEDEIRNLNAVLGECLKLQLAAEGVSTSLVHKFLEHLYQLEISKSNNFSIIATASHLQKYLFRHLECRNSGSTALSETDVSLELARYPILNLKEGEKFPHKAFREELLKRYGTTGKFPFEVPTNSELH